jgi:hypothetical protein
LKPTIELTLRGFDDGVRSAYARLFPGDPDKSPEMLAWRFERNPHGAAKFAVALAGGEVVGMIALVPTKLRSAAGHIMAYQAIDTVVDPACRGQGLFVRLGALTQDRDRVGGDILWGFPNANAAPGWYGRLGWTNFGAVPMLIKPLRTGFIFGRVQRALRRIDFPLARTSGEQFEPIDEFGADCGALWTAAAAEMGITVDRSADWMRWRLVDKPGADYRVVALRGKAGLGGLVATRLADKHGARLCYCMDAFARREHRADLVAALRSEMGRAASGGAEAALAWCAPHALSYAAYREAGFYPFPARLRPIEINFGARALDAGLALEQPWTVSLLDSDTN